MVAGIGQPYRLPIHQCTGSLGERICRVAGQATATQLQTSLGRLRPRDLEVVRALVEYPWLGEPDIARQLGMGLHNLRARAKHSYAVLGVESRLHLFAVYHTALLGTCCCSPRPGIPTLAASGEESR